MATTLSPRAPKRGAIKPGQLEIFRAVAAMEDAALRHGLAHTLPTIRAIGQVWLAHPDGPLPYPAQETIAARIGRSARTVRRHIAALEAVGLLAVFRTCARPGGADGRLVRRSNRYQFRDRMAAALRACPLPRRRRRSSDLEDTRVPRPPDGGAVPAPPPPIEAPPAPKLDEPPEQGPPEELVDARQVVAEWRAALVHAQPAVGRRLTAEQDMRLITRSTARRGLRSALSTHTHTHTHTPLGRPGGVEHSAPHGEQGGEQGGELPVEVGPHPAAVSVLVIPPLDLSVVPHPALPTSRIAGCGSGAG